MHIMHVHTYTYYECIDILYERIHYICAYHLYTWHFLVCCFVQIAPFSPAAAAAVLLPVQQGRAFPTAPAALQLSK